MSRSLRGGQSKESVEVQKKQMEVGKEQKVNSGAAPEKKTESKRPELKVEKKEEKNDEKKEPEGKKEA